MKLIYVCAMAVCAMVLTVALMPVSGWTFRNSADLILQIPASASFEAEDGYNSIIPAWLGQPDTYLGADPALELTRAMFMRESNIGTGHPNMARHNAVVRYTAAHPADATGWAVLIREACVFGSHPPDDPKSRDKNVIAAAGDFLKVGRDACRRGEALEPINAYFPLMAATLDLDLDLIPDMLSELRKAANCPDFDNHIRGEAGALERAQRLAKGYRGEVVRNMMVATILLPDYAHIKSMARYLCRHHMLSAQRDLLQTQGTIIKGETTMIGLLVALSDTKITICPPVPLNGTRKTMIEESELPKLAAQFDRRLSEAHLNLSGPSVAEMYATQTRLLDASRRYFALADLRSAFVSSASDMFAQAVVQGGGSTVALFAILLAIPLLLGSYLFSLIQSDAFRTMFPHFVYVPVWFAFAHMYSPCEGCSTLTVVGIQIGIAQISLALLRVEKNPAILCMSITAIAYLVLTMISPLENTWFSYVLCVVCLGMISLPFVMSRDNRRRIATYGGMGLVLASPLDPSGLAIVCGIVYSLAVFATWKAPSGKVPWIASGLAIFLALATCLACAGGVLWQGLVGHIGIELLWYVALLVLAAGLFVGKPFGVLRAGVCTVLVVVGATYLISVGYQVRVNHRLTVASPGLLNEGAEIRKMAGVSSR